MAKIKTVKASQIRRQLWNSFSPDDYDDRGEPYLRKGMTQKQISEGLKRKHADMEKQDGERPKS